MAPNFNPQTQNLRLMTWGSMLASHAILFLATTRVVMKNFPEKPADSVVTALAYGAAVAMAIIGMLFLKHSRKISNGYPYFIISMALFETIGAIAMVSVFFGVSLSTYYGLAASGVIMHLTAFPFKSTKQSLTP